MVDNEMLVAIEELLDRKLEEKLEEKLEAKFDEKLKPIYERMDNMQEQINEVKEDVRYIRVVQLENNVLPRLNTIESCYLDTYKRYQEKNEKMDGAFQDIEVLKKVVENHSERILALEA